MGSSKAAIGPYLHVSRAKTSNFRCLTAVCVIPNPGVANRQIVRIGYLSIISQVRCLEVLQRSISWRDCLEQSIAGMSPNSLDDEPKLA